MVTAPDSPVAQAPVGQTVPPLIVTWEPLPDDVPLDDEPVENTVNRYWQAHSVNPSN